MANSGASTRTTPRKRGKNHEVRNPRDIRKNFFVYVIQAAPEIIKIGVAKDPAERLRARDVGDTRFLISERELEMKRAELFKDAIVKERREGKSVQEIAKAYGLQTREVQAAVYIEIQAGRAGGVYKQN